jgi:uncharacterized protein YbjT (DUF2867 family)
MKVLLTGATGLIGSELAACLAREGHQVVGLARKPSRSLNVASWVMLDVAATREAKDWRSHLEGIDAVINCAGVLQDSAQDDTEGVHSAGVAALFAACEQTGVRRVIHLSAIGVDRTRPSRFSVTKYAGDRQLMSRNLEWVILRPSVVLGRAAFGASALIRALASLPVIPVMPDTQPLQVVQLSDVLKTISFFLKAHAPARLELELAGPDRLQMAEIVAQYRNWLGWRPARCVTLPRWLAAVLYRLGDVAGALGWRPPVRTNAAREIARGAVGDPGPWMSICGIRPRSLPAALAAEPATIQEKWFAPLYLLKAVIFPVLAGFWIATGLISLTVGYESGVELMRSTGSGMLSGPAVAAGALADITVGICIAWRSTARYGLSAALLLSLFYAIAGTILRPDLWIEPLGPLMKILPILALHLVGLAVLDDR